ncbi:MAG: amidohydrolase family protein, partial [Candidatus Lokiarchaeota archaeon]|nr:amidohydrolase family protein [Candidatus Lokiarchaeota archaeon]MBD3339025.1 amidohydrolase family protein [Candidatus Lokiarchaeota archaeon]
MTDKKIYYNGVIITMNDRLPNIDAVGIEGERIVAVGNFEEVKKKLNNSLLIDLKGKTLLPGFHDAHCHPIAYLFFFVNLNLRNLESFEGFLQLLKDAAKERKPDEWIFGLSYDELNFQDPVDRKLPTRWDLDQVCPNNPVFILRFDGHVGVANSKALEIAKIDLNTKPPEGSEYRKNKKGEITGVMTEKAVMNFITQYSLPKPEKIKEAAKNAFKYFAEKGITTVHGIIHLGAGGEVGDLGAIEMPIMKLVQDKILQNWYSLVHTKTPKKLKRIKKPPLDEGTKEGKFKIGGLKLYIDGSLGASNAWMHEPFSDDPSLSGDCIYDDISNLYAQLKKAHILGFQVAVHAIGDRGNRE